MESRSTQRRIRSCKDYSFVADDGRDAIPLKYCYRCNEDLPFSEFHGDAAQYDRTHSKCKDCCKEYYQENKDKISAYQKEYYQENRDRELAYQKEYYQKNKDKISAYKKEYYQKNRDRIKEGRKRKKGGD